MSRRFAKELISTGCIAIALALTGCGGAGTRPAASAVPIEGESETESAAAERARPAETERFPVADLDGAALVPPLEIPEDAAASYARALAAIERGDLAAAERELEALLLEQPALAGPYVNLAIIYRQDGRDDEAEAALARALAIAPNHPAANNELGILERERGNFTAAEDAYRRAIAGDPSYSLAHYNLGVLLDIYLQRPDEALEQYESYQSLTAEIDAEVDRWILDLRRRLGLPQPTEQVAQEAGQ